MPIVTLGDLFNKFRCVFERKKRFYPSFNGQEYWRRFKPILAESGYKAKKGWKKIPNKEFNRIMSKSEYTINGFGEKSIDLANHCEIQTVRIPKNEPPNFRKIMQIAINVGQYNGIKKQKKKLMKKSHCKHYLYIEDVNTPLSKIFNEFQLQKILSLMKN